MRIKRDVNMLYTYTRDTIQVLNKSTILTNYFRLNKHIIQLYLENIKMLYLCECDTSRANADTKMAS